MKDISFTTNWNNKLNCMAFTTIRISSQTYQVGESYNVKLKGRIQGIYKIVSKKTILLNTVNDWMGLLDTGYNATETARIIKKIHNARNYDWETQKLDYILLVKEKSE